MEGPWPIAQLAYQPWGYPNRADQAKDVEEEAARLSGVLCPTLRKADLADDLEAATSLGSHGVDLPTLMAREAGIEGAGKTQMVVGLPRRH